LEVCCGSIGDIDCVCVCHVCDRAMCTCFFFFKDTAPTEIYTLSLHDALPISRCCPIVGGHSPWQVTTPLRSGILTPGRPCGAMQDRKSTRLNSSHSQISYAVFCLKKKKKHYVLPARRSTTAPYCCHHRLPRRS